jgi:hypothetical protein
VLELVLLVTMDGIDQKLREIVPQMQLVVDAERAGRELDALLRTSHRDDCRPPDLRAR